MYVPSLWRRWRWVLFLFKLLFLYVYTLSRRKYPSSTFMLYSSPKNHEIHISRRGSSVEILVLARSIYLKWVKKICDWIFLTTWTIHIASWLLHDCILINRRWVMAWIFVNFYCYKWLILEVTHWMEGMDLLTNRQHYHHQILISSIWGSFSVLLFTQPSVRPSCCR